MSDMSDKTFAEYELEAADWIAEHGTDVVVAELRKAVTERRRVKLGTVNTLILLAHIDRVEGQA